MSEQRRVKNHLHGSIVHLCTFEAGGAGRAAHRLHHGLKTLGVNSTFLVAGKCSNDPGVHAIPPAPTSFAFDYGTGEPFLWHTISQRWSGLLAQYPSRPSGLEIFSDTSSSYHLTEIKEIADAEIINLHWVAGLLNYPEISQAFAGKKLVWTLHDMNPFTGGCHYSGTCDRYTQSCGKCPQLGSNDDGDLTRRIWEEKYRALECLDISVVTPSRWLARCAAASSLFSRFPVSVIPNGVPADIFRPYSKTDVRRRLGLPENAKVILFGADDLSKKRKGFEHLLRAMSRFNPNGDKDRIVLVVFGNLGNRERLHSKYPVVELGYLETEEKMAVAYNLADVYVLPSMEDNLPNTLLEAMSCGVPVVGFDVGGMPDVIEHRRTGYLAAPGDIDGLVDGINWCLSKGESQRVSSDCRTACLARYTDALQAAAYCDLYTKSIARTSPITSKGPVRSEGSLSMYAHPSPKNGDFALTARKFQDFAYAKKHHFACFEDNDLELFKKRVDSGYCDLKAYQDLLVFTFIKNNLPIGSRILDVGGGDSRILKYFQKDYECWNIDKLEGIGNGPRTVTPEGYRLVRDYMGNFNAELPEDYFDFVFSISTLEHVPNGRNAHSELYKNICLDIDRVLKPGGISLHCFDIKISDRVPCWSNDFLAYLSEFFSAEDPFIPVEQVARAEDLYVMSEQYFQDHWVPLNVKWKFEEGRPSSRNILWTKPLNLNSGYCKDRWSNYKRFKVLKQERFPKITVVTPSYNKSKYLEECIESVLGQNYPNLEYIIMDGGSTDGSVDIIRRYGQFLSYWQSGPDGGQYKAIDDGFRRSTGEILTWINADDKLIAGALAEVAQIAVKSPEVQWVGGHRLIIGGDGHAIEHDPLTTFPQETIANGLCDGIHWQFVQQEGLFFRRSLYERAGGLNSAFRYAGDWDLWRRMAVHAPRHAVDKQLGAFRRHTNQKTEDLAPYWAEIDATIPRHIRSNAARSSKTKTVSTTASVAPAAAVSHGDASPSPAFLAAENWRLHHFPDGNWPKITIVTPSYNQGLFLEACMRSVLDQGYPNLEYIVMDGGSTDNSVGIIKKYASCLAYWQSRPDGGQYQAIMDGLNRGTGEIMAWLNADDVYHGPCLFKVAMLFMCHPHVRWLFGMPTVVDVVGQLQYMQRDITWSRARILNIDAALKYEFIGQDSVFWRKDLWEEAGSTINTSLKLAADYDLWVRFCRHAYLYPVHDAFSSFRYHGNQKSVDFKKEYFEEMVSIIKNELNSLSPESNDAFRRAPEMLPSVYREVFPPLAQLPKNSVSEGFGLVETGPHYVALRENLRKAEDLLRNQRSEFDYFQRDDAGPLAAIMQQWEEIDCVSFDFFDTLVYRLCDEPTRLFIEVSRRLRSQNILSEDISDHAFRIMRIRAEHLARMSKNRLNNTYECTLEDIYEQLKEIVSDIHAASQIELETEQDFCFLNPSIQCLVSYVKNMGKKTALLSDNYLSPAQIVSILKHNGFNIEVFDLVLTSSGLGVTKAEGKLFEIAQKRLGIDSRRWIHLGDNEEADVRGAGLAGVQGVHYYRTTPSIQQVVLREQSLRSCDHYSGSLNAFRVAASRMGGMIPENWRGFFRDGAFLFGPPLARYADWAVGQCRKEGITKALVLMREAQTLKPMITQAAKAHGVQLQAVPFYVSRHSVNLASLVNLSAESLYHQTLKHRAVTPRALLSSLDLSPEMIPEIPSSIYDRNMSSMEHETLCVFLAHHPICRRILERRSASRRNLFVSYMKQYISNQEKVAIIDLGFRGTIQFNIDRILSHMNIQLKTVGLYFATADSAADKLLAGTDIRSFLGALSYGERELLTFMKHPEIIEEAINSVCGTTINYFQRNDGSVCPVLEDRQISFEQAYPRWLMQQGIISFQTLWLKFFSEKIYRKNNRSLDLKWLDEIDEQCMTIIQRLSCFPTQDEAKRLGSMYHDDNDGVATGDIICDKRSRDVYKEKGFGELEKIKPYWPHGVVALETPHVFDHIFAVKGRFENP